MNYKNNYQRKQAVWREKWLKKEEKRLRQRELNKLKTDIANFGGTIGEAIQLITDELHEIIASAGSLVKDIIDEIDISDKI